MAAREPAVEFTKNANDNVAENDFDISWKYVGDPPSGGPGTINGNLVNEGEQTQNWINKNSQVGPESETSLWDQVSLDVYNPAAPDPDHIDSGCGLVDSAGVSRDTIRGNETRAEHIRVYNNRAQLWRTGGGAGDQQVSAAENCRMKVYDRPTDGVVSQTDEPIVATDGAADGLFWTSIQQLDYYYWDGSWNAMGGANVSDPALLGFNAAGPLSHSVLLEPHASLPVPPAYPCLNEYLVGDLSGPSRFLGTRQSEAGAPTNGYKDAEGGYILLEVKWLVPENASARFHSLGLAIEYTFVLE